MPRSTGQRAALRWASVSSGRSAGALERKALSSPSGPRPRRRTTQTSGPGSRSRTATARTQATSATSGPLAPSLRRWRRQAVGGRVAASAGQPQARRSAAVDCHFGRLPMLPMLSSTLRHGRNAMIRSTRRRVKPSCRSVKERSQLLAGPVTGALVVDNLPDRWYGYLNLSVTPRLKAGESSEQSVESARMARQRDARVRNV